MAFTSFVGIDRGRPAVSKLTIDAALYVSATDPSLHRNGDPAESPEAFRQCLRRTMHIATHETGHILALKHCTAFECNMNGANSVSETDRHPLHFCPVCLRKLLWNLDAKPDAYLSELETFFTNQPLNNESTWYATAQQHLPP